MRGKGGVISFMTLNSSYHLVRELLSARGDRTVNKHCREYNNWQLEAGLTSHRAYVISVVTTSALIRFRFSLNTVYPMDFLCTAVRWFP